MKNVKYILKKHVKNFNAMIWSNFVSIIFLSLQLPQIIKSFVVGFCLYLSLNLDKVYMLKSVQVLLIFCFVFTICCMNTSENKPTLVTWQNHIYKQNSDHSYRLGIVVQFIIIFSYYTIFCFDENFYFLYVQS